MNSVLIDNTLEALINGKTILYPTDTIWGIGCDATLADAIDRIYAIKERDHSKSMLILATEQMLSPTLPQNTREILLHSDRPTTVILPAEYISIQLAPNLLATDGTIGIRIPKFDFCQRLLSRLTHPIVSTSANLSGEPSPNSYDDISPTIIDRVDFALPNDQSFYHPIAGSSRILRVTNSGETIVIRG